MATEKCIFPPSLISTGAASSPYEKKGGLSASFEQTLPSYCCHDGGKFCQIPCHAFKGAQRKTEDVTPTWTGRVCTTLEKKLRSEGELSSMLASNGYIVNHILIDSRRVEHSDTDLTVAYQ